MSELDIIEETEVTPVENTEEVSDETERPQDEIEAEAEDTEESANSEEPEKPKRVSRAQKRINELTREKYEAQKQLEAMQQQMLQMQQKQQPETPTDEMPTIEQFDYDQNAYQQAMQGWVNSQFQKREESARTQQMQMQQMAAAQEQQRKLQETMSKGQEKYPDFMQKVMDPTLPSLSDVNPAAYQAVVESDVDIDVAYYLANNPQEVYALANVSPIQAVRRIAELEVQMKAKPQTSQPLSKPPSTVSGKTDSAPNPSEMTTEEYMAWRNKQVHG